ncbi:hypothetical protein [Bacillus sp. SM2101]|uniref:hypothetical protein n=1 Tax=Bacillus sp. SM2101 TaxID=2805366 RepID=UPI001BDE8698|nr:hypothetical protein [Bacillus sp. SM2101]
MQKGEREFTHTVVRAIMRRDMTSSFILYMRNNLLNYRIVKNGADPYLNDAYIICVINP